LESSAEGIRQSCHPAGHVAISVPASKDDKGGRTGPKNGAVKMRRKEVQTVASRKTMTSVGPVSWDEYQWR